MAERTDPRSLALTGLEPLVRAVLATLGALVTHQIAYPLMAAVGADLTANGDHGHLSLQWALITPIAVFGVVAVIVRQIRRLGFVSVISTPRLAGLTAGFFIVQEAAENVFAGGSGVDIVRNPAVLLGLGLVPVVAWLLVRLLDDLAELIGRWLAPPSNHSGPHSGLIPIPVRWSDNRRGTPSRPRGPPRRRR